MGTDTGQGFLRFEGVSKAFDGVKAVDGVTLSVRKGEIFSLLGPSGCGKTTLLRICAGLETPDAGRVLLDGRDITELPPHERPVNTVFQNYALFPHLSLWENIAFGLRVKGLPRQRIRDEVDAMLGLIQMTDQAHKKPAQISGGQKQRVAIARALVNRPQVLLLDEPLAALDLKLRQKMLVELDDIHDEVGLTFLYVTHDQGEAMGLSDRIAVMNNGVVEQVGTPGEIYETPGNSFTAAFIGDTNFFEGVVKGAAGDGYSVVGVDGFPCEVVCFNDRPRKAGDQVHLSIRPERFVVSLQPAEAGPLHNQVEGIVEEMIYLGAQTRYRILAGAHRLSVLRQHSRFLLDEKPPSWKDRVWVRWHADDGYMLERFRDSDRGLLPLSEQA
ncbi:MAG: ABC transporter ATP-binding protein [Lentisphaerae bacterium]|nr:ABC transporter ATP-binding protein [Lentisphaerota bacterium]